VAEREWPSGTQAKEFLASARDRRPACGNHILQLRMLPAFQLLLPFLTMTTPRRVGYDESPIDYFFWSHVCIDLIC
jgi:hypothetical protein